MQDKKCTQMGFNFYAFRGGARIFCKWVAHPNTEKHPGFEKFKMTTHLITNGFNSAVLKNFELKIMCS